MDQERFWRIAAYHAGWKRYVFAWVIDGTDMIAARARDFD